jgi:hypothetical protein
VQPETLLCTHPHFSEIDLTQLAAEIGTSGVIVPSVRSLPSPSGQGSSLSPHLSTAPLLLRGSWSEHLHFYFTLHSLVALGPQGSHQQQEDGKALGTFSAAHGTGGPSH